MLSLGGAINGNESIKEVKLQYTNSLLIDDFDDLVDKSCSVQILREHIFYANLSNIRVVNHRASRFPASGR